MTERPDKTRLHDWLDDTVGQTPDPVEGTRQVMSQVEETSQVGRWLPFTVFHRNAKAKTPTTADTKAYQPGPISATNGQTATITGRTQSMLSPAKAITAGALVLALGGVMLIAQPFDQQESVPAAEGEPVAATWVTGNIIYAPSCSGPDSEQDGAVRHDWNYECSPQRWTASDPRLSGEAASLWNEDVYQTDNGFVAVNTTADFLKNDDGGWACSSPNLYEGFGQFPTYLTGKTATCVGQGGYEGLSALLVIQESEASHPFVGLIFSGGFPPLPEPPVAE